jgi:hypothetical protein
MRLSIVLVAALTACGVLLPTDTAGAATVNYSGTLYNNSGAPIQGGLVIAGTFKPSFNVSNYACTYSDAFCNPYDNNYSLAVADGNFIPLNSGVVTNVAGLFSGSGISTAAGSQIWLFAFTGSQPNGNGGEVLASGSGGSYLVPASGSTTATALGANQFIFGEHFSNGFKTAGLPFPEPASAAILAVGAISLGTFRTRRNSLHRA